MSVRALAVGFVAAATLAFEILLVRVFAVEHFHHIAYMAIGVAMLGIGATGAFIAAIGELSPHVAERWFRRATLLTTLALVAVPAALHRIPLDLTQLAWNFEQWMRLGLVYLLLALPFALGALAILLAITLDAERPGWMYGASFLGSGTGALLAIGILWAAHPSRALAFPAVVAALGTVVTYRPGRTSIAQFAAPLIGVMVAVLALVRPPWRMVVSPYKGLPQVEAYPDAQRVAERTSPLGWVVAVQAPAFRHAPGLSLAYAGEFPPQTALFVDGDIAGAVTHWADRSAMGILTWLPTAIPYALGGRDRVLIVGAGEGMEAWSAVAHGARRIVAIEPNTVLTAVSAQLSPLPTRESTGVGIDWMASDARTAVAGMRERFDLITLAASGGLGSAAGGVHALNEDFLHTTEAYTAYLQRLTPDGVLAITRWATVPPRGEVRAILTAAEALRRLSPGALRNGVVVARSWGTTTILVKPSGYASADLDRVRTWASNRQIDLDWFPDAVDPIAEYHIPNDPTLVQAARAAVSHADSARRFAETYPFSVAPATDARPYPHRFLRAGSLRTLLRSGATNWLPFAEWGYIALIATLAQSVLLATLLIVLPALLISRRRRAATTGGHGSSLLQLLTYFCAIGVGYMAAEIALIQQLTLLLGYPVYAVATVLAAILICSGLGSYWSDRVAPSRGTIIAANLSCVLALFALVVLAVVHRVQAASLPARSAVAIVLLSPVAALMGTLFPLGVRGLAAGDGRRIALSWAANGFASVVAVPLSALIAVEGGSRVLLFVAASLYVLAALAIRHTHR